MEIFQQVTWYAQTSKGAALAISCDPLPQIEFGRSPPSLQACDLQNVRIRARAPIESSRPGAGEFHTGVVSVSFGMLSSPRRAVGGSAATSNPREIVRVATAPNLILNVRRENRGPYFPFARIRLHESCSRRGAQIYDAHRDQGRRSRSGSRPIGVITTTARSIRRRLFGMRAPSPCRGSDLQGEKMASSPERGPRHLSSPAFIRYRRPV